MKEALLPAASQMKTLKTKDQMAKEMGIHVRTFSRHLQKAGLSVPRGLIYPEHQEEIHKKLGWKG